MESNTNDKKVNQLVIEDEDEALEFKGIGSSLSLVDLAVTRAIDQNDIEDDNKDDEEFVSFINENDEDGGEHREDEENALKRMVVSSSPKQLERLRRIVLGNALQQEPIVLVLTDVYHEGMFLDARSSPAELGWNRGVPRTIMRTFAPYGVLYNSGDAITPYEKLNFQVWVLITVGN